MYDLFRKTANDEYKSISGFIEYTTLSDLSDKTYVSDDEMEQIDNDTNLVKSLKDGLSDIEKCNYKIVR